MDYTTAVLRTIDRLYASVTDEREWAAALLSLSELVGGAGAFHLMVNAPITS